MRIARPFSGLPLTVPLLVTALGVSTALAWQAWEAARSQRATVDRVLRDYVDFAAWEFSRSAGRELESVFDRWLADGCECKELAARSTIRVARSTGHVSVTGEPLPEGARAWMERATAGDAPARHGPRHVGLATLGGRPRLLAARVQHAATGTGHVMVGAVADASAIEPFMKRMLARTPLLPPTLAGTANEWMQVELAGADGTPLFVSNTGATEGAPIRATGTLDASAGGWRYTISLSPRAADHLVIGGLPRSRLPLLLGMLAVTAGLLVAAALQLRREARLTRLRSDFVSSVSHELRTPLAQIRLFTETLLLDRVRTPQEAHRCLEVVHQESRRLTHLVDNVLYFSSPGRGRQANASAAMSIARAARDVVDAFEPLAASAGVSVEMETNGDPYAAVDGHAFRQILLNLLDNAVKYGGKDRTVRVTLFSRGARCGIAVDDEGPGIPPEHRDRVWEPYFRLAAAAHGAAGAGIGLSVVRDLVQRHGGAARVESAPSGGARLVVEFPLAGAVEHAA